MNIKKGPLTGADMKTNLKIKERCRGAEPLQGRRSFRAADQPVPSSMQTFIQKNVLRVEGFKVRILSSADFL